MSKSRKILAIVIAIAITFSFSAFTVVSNTEAATATDTHTATFTCNSAATIALRNSGDTADVTTVSLGSGAPGDALTTSNDVVVPKVTCNDTWSLGIKAADFTVAAKTWALSGNRFQFSRDNTTPTWTSITTSNVDYLTAQAATGSTAWHDETNNGVEYKANLDYDCSADAGTYSSTVTYTVTTSL